MPRQDQLQGAGLANTEGDRRSTSVAVCGNWFAMVMILHQTAQLTSVGGSRKGSPDTPESQFLIRTSAGLDLELGLGIGCFAFGNPLGKNPALAGARSAAACPGIGHIPLKRAEP